MPTVLITGSSRGIGQATAEALRARGARVIGHASRPTDDRDTIAADFTDPPAPQWLWEEAQRILGIEVDGQDGMARFRQ